MIHSSRIHLNSVNENYFEHQRVAFRFAGQCLKAAIMAFVHGVVPGWLQSSASNLVKQLANHRKPKTDSAELP